MTKKILMPNKSNALIQALGLRNESKITDVLNELATLTQDEKFWVLTQDNELGLNALMMAAQAELPLIVKTMLAQISTLTSAQQLQILKNPYNHLLILMAIRKPEIFNQLLNILKNLKNVNIQKLGIEWFTMTNPQGNNMLLGAIANGDIVIVKEFLNTIRKWPASDIKVIIEQVNPHTKNNILASALSYSIILAALLNAMTTEYPEFRDNAKALLQQVHPITKCNIPMYIVSNLRYPSDINKLVALLNAITELKFSPQEIAHFFSQADQEGNTLINKVLETQNPEVITLMQGFINTIADEKIQRQILNVNVTFLSNFLMRLIYDPNKFNTLLTNIKTLKLQPQQIENAQITSLINLLRYSVQSPDVLSPVLTLMKTLKLTPEHIESVFNPNQNEDKKPLLLWVNTPKNAHIMLDFISTIPNKDIQARILKNFTAPLYQGVLNDALTKYGNEFKNVLQQIEQLPKEALVELYQNQTLVAFNKRVNDTENRIFLFQAQMRVSLAMINEKINDLPESLQDSAYELIDRLDARWQKYRANNDPHKTEDLQIEFAAALADAKPLFIETEQGFGFLNWLIRIYNYLFHYSELTQIDEKSFREVEQIGVRFSSLNPSSFFAAQKGSGEGIPNTTGEGNNLGEEGMPQYPVAEGPGLKR